MSAELIPLHHGTIGAENIQTVDAAQELSPQPKAPLAIAIGEKIRQARQKKGWTQARMALELGARQQAVCKWENAHANPSGKRLGEIAEALGVTPGSLYPERQILHPEEVVADA